MASVVVACAGMAVLVLGIVSRRPWGRWWSGGGAPSEQFATLIAPPMGLACLCIGLDMLVDEDGIFSAVMSLIFLPSLTAGIWAGLSLPVPDRVLVKGSFIRADRRRRRQRRQERRERRRRGRSAD